MKLLCWQIDEMLQLDCLKKKRKKSLSAPEASSAALLIVESSCADVRDVL